MDAGVTPFRSILDKPLIQLTDEDISQLTREDCRKYLKEKGMRRPSWNKSQAIQQVISLKALLETSDDSGAAALRKILVSKPPATPNSTDSVKEASGDATNNNTVSVSADDTVPSRQNDSPKSNPRRPLDCQAEDADDKIVATPRSDYIEQMTIFYCGKVNVFDGVPPDKAREIMHLASNSIHPLQPLDDPVSGHAALTYPCHLQTVSDNHGIVSATAPAFQTMQTEKLTEYPPQYGEKHVTQDPDLEGQANRKVSLQRYLDKRKDRGRFKGRKNLGRWRTSSLDVYMNHPVRTHSSNVQLTKNSSDCPPQHGVPHVVFSSSENQAKTANFLDLNEGSYREMSKKAEYI